MPAIARRRLDPDVRRQEIMDAAERLLRKNGPDVRVEDVVREAGAAKGTFYLYFPAWDDLLEAIRGRLVKAFDESHPVRIRTGSKLDWPRAIDRLAVAFVDEMIAMAGLHIVLFHTDFAQRRPISEQDNPINRLTGMIRAGRAAGAFGDIDTDRIGPLLFAVIHATADAVEAGEDRKRALAAMHWILRRALAPKTR